MKGSIGRPMHIQKLRKADKIKMAKYFKELRSKKKNKGLFNGTYTKQQADTKY